MAEEINAPGVVELAPANAFAERKNRSDLLSFGITSVLLLAIYLFTLTPSVTLGNAGYFAAAANFAGVPSPPGYPLWTIYSWLFTRLLPFSSVAWRVAAGSAVAASLACGIVASIVSRGGGIMMKGSSRFAHLTGKQKRSVRIVCGYVAGMVLGLSGAVWGKAVIVDIWSLSLLLFCLILWCGLRWLSNPEKRRYLYAMFLFQGLLLTSSQEMILALPALVALTMRGDRELFPDLALVLLPVAALLTVSFQYVMWFTYRGVPNQPLLLPCVIVMFIAVLLIARTRCFGSKWKEVLLCCGCFALGLSLCFYLPIASMTNPPMNWGYPRTVEGFFHVLSRGQYEKVYPTDNLDEYVHQLWLFAKMCAREVGWPYLIPVLLPFLAFLRSNRTSRKRLMALLVIFICVGPLLVAELRPVPDRQSVELITIYFIPSFAVLSVFSGLGLVLIAGRFARPKAGF